MENEIFKEKYEAMIFQISSNKQIEINFKIDNFYELDQDDYLFDKKRLVSKFFIPEVFFKYYITNDFLKLSWNFRIENFNASGGDFNLKSFILFLNNPLDTAFKANVSLDDAKLLKDGYRFFDRPNEYDRAAIKITDGKIEEKVYFINELNIPQKMVLTYPEYMEQVIKIKGLQHWQYLFIEGLKFDDVQFGLERELGERLKMIKEVFPDEDFTEFFKLFEGLK